MGDTFTLGRFKSTPVPFDEVEDPKSSSPKLSLSPIFATSLLNFKMSANQPSIQLSENENFLLM